MTPAIDFTNVQPFNQGERIEQVIQLPRFQNRVRNKVIPFYSITKTPRVNLAQINALVKEFVEEIRQKSSRFCHIAPTYFIQHFSSAARKIFEYEPNAISVELTSATSIFLLSQIREDKVYLELFFDEHAGHFSKAVLNIFAHKQQQLAVSGSFTEVLRELDYYFNPAAHIAEYYPYTAYELSGSTDTTLSF